VISPSQQPLPDTQHSKEKNIKAVGGIRTSNLGQRAASGRRPTPFDRAGAGISSLVMRLAQLLKSKVGYKNIM